ncbi:MAG: carbamoyltransferase HypF [Rhodobacteraceae bacterium]|nr:carbamoyltransferase HypF [Paracoccaceae bacterium]
MAERRLIRIRGQVQGVGFRPFVWRLARRLGIRGEVMNDGEGVLVRAFGPGPALDALERALVAEAPPLARIDAVEARALPPGPLPEGFAIAASAATGADTAVAPDAATCPDCAAEIRDPAARRHGHAFANCTCCGPRFSIIAGLPYDRARTAMAAFPMCPDCAREYGDPADRRFHAQPVACPACGPRLWFETGGRAVPGEAVALAAGVLKAGGIVAVKGIGGFHLACDATAADAVLRLRAFKRRPVKPFALMGTEAMIRRHAGVSRPALALLRDPAAPIVLLPMAGEALPEAIAPGQGRLGWMLPHAPLHHLLLDAAGRPLVMTSANRSGEPPLAENAEARAQLAGMADGFLMHDREILRRQDDSVECADPPMVLRRGRGRVPGALPLPAGFAEAPPVTAYGGQIKAAICLLRQGQALLSQHLGDLGSAPCRDEYVRTDADLATLFGHRPVAVACDLHPAYASTAHAEGKGLPLHRVQHHHAHLAACLAENGWPRDGGPVAGILLDGTGLGEDGTIWGGEILVGDYRAFRRVAWLRPAPLAGGDAASREPWRNAVMRLDQAGLPGLADRIFADRPVAAIRRLAAAGTNAPPASSAGRLLDAAAAILGFPGLAQGFEGEAAMWLEALAGTGGRGAGEVVEAAGLDPAGMIRALAAGLDRGVPRARLAAGIQTGLALAFARGARAEVEAGRAMAVALSGGCFQNRAILAACRAALRDIPVMTHRRVPANDGGLALGQALVAAARLEGG